MAAIEAIDADGPPTTVQGLEQRVAEVAVALGIAARRARVLVSSVIVAQMLPDGSVVKGGMGIKFRLGEIGTRATQDVDVVARDHDAFVAAMSARLAEGWGSVPPSKSQIKKNADAPPRLAFSGELRATKQADPIGVPPQYLMRPYRVTLSFMGKPWAGVPLEVAHDEIDGMEYAELEGEPAQQLIAIATVLGFGDLAPIPLISLEQQIAQKLHAVTYPGSERVHDLVDLQLLWRIGTADGGDLDLALLEGLCGRTFAFRAQHSWPPTATMSAILEEAYKTAVTEARLRPGAAELDEGAEKDVDESADVSDVQLADSLQDALDWVNDRINEVVGVAGDTAP